MRLRDLVGLKFLEIALICTIYPRLAFSGITSAGRNMDAHINGSPPSCLELLVRSRDVTGLKFRQIAELSGFSNACRMPRAHIDRRQKNAEWKNVLLNGLRSFRSI